MPGKIIFAVFVATAFALPVQGQIPDRKPTGYLTDASEEYWPTDSAGRSVPMRKSLNIFHGEGSVTSGFTIRESFEYFKAYLWGIGTQDKNGYLLHRALVHSNVKYNQHFRMFVELQSSLISGRSGGPRPVQDQNELAINQFYGEITVKERISSRFKFRFGKQHLSYGRGTLLDLRDANVRRSFVGGKVQAELPRSTLAVFAMKAVNVQNRMFDDEIDHGQKIGGLWMTYKFAGLLTKADIYYLLISRNRSNYNQGTGKEIRNTLGIGLTLNKKQWFGFSEFDFQWGKFSSGRILAWKIAPSLGYKFSYIKFVPAVSIQGAISSGDNNDLDGKLETFNPIYPKAIFYGFIDNAGSSNLVVIHPNAELTIKANMTLTFNYYRFWRQSVGDGIYAVNGSFLLPASGASRHVGDMIDLYAHYRVGKHWAFQLISVYYIRGPYLKRSVATNSDILYFGLKTTVHI